jgi:hypothetical protein
MPAREPGTDLRFTDAGCSDCAELEAKGMPDPLPPVGDDLDRDQRDHDSFRLAMLEDLAARVPERQRWTAADLEVVLVELLASQLDELSDALDRAAAEAYLETARRPDSVLRLLSLIGFEPVSDAIARGLLEPSGTRGPETDPHARERLKALWRDNPWAMDIARRGGPPTIRRQRRLVTLDDHGTALEEHPFVARAAARSAWSGSWPTVDVTIVLRGNAALDERIDHAATVDELAGPFRRFEADWQLREPRWRRADPPGELPRYRDVLQRFVDAHRMVGTEVLLEDARPVGIVLALSIEVADHHFRSQVRMAVAAALGTDPSGFFAPGRMAFGEDLLASDLFEWLGRIDGVVSVHLVRFKRIGRRYPDASDAGRIVLRGTEIARCDNRPGHERYGYWRLTLHGGRRG